MPHPVFPQSKGYGQSAERVVLGASRKKGPISPEAFPWVNETISGVTLQGQGVDLDFEQDDLVDHMARISPETELVNTQPDFEPTPVDQVVSGRSARHDPETWKFGGEALLRIERSGGGNSKPPTKK